MIRWLLNNVSTVGIVFLFVVGAFLLAAGGFLLAESMFPRLRESNFNMAATEVKGAFTLLFGLILALTIAGLSTNNAAASSTISSESTALAQLSRTAQDFSTETRTVFKAAIGQYVHAVAEDEFTTMGDGKSSPVAAAALANLYGVYQAYTPSATDSAAYSSSLSKIDALTAFRRERLQQSAQSLSPLLRIMLLIGTIVFIILAYPVNIESRPVRLMVVGLIAAFVSFVFALTILLDFPFVGEIAVSNGPYKEAALAQYWPGL